MLRRLGIQAGELRLLAWGAGTLFLLGWAEVSVKNAAEVFFIKRIDVKLLPLAFLVSSLLLVLTTWAVGRLAARSDRPRLLPKILLGLAVALVPLWLLVRGNVSSGFALLLIASKQIESIGLLMFLQALGDLLHPRQAKRLFAPLMAGMTLGTILGSFASEPLSGRLGIDGLLPFSAGIMGAAALCSLPLRRGRVRLEPRSGRAGEGAREPRTPGAGEQTSLVRLWQGSRLFRLLALTTLFNALLGPMLYFQFQYVADVATAGRDAEDQLLSIYAWFRGWISVGILFIQLGLASGIYRRIGLPLAAAFSPLVYLVGFAGLSVRLSLPVGVGALAGTKLVDDAVYDPALRVLYNLFREGIRSRASSLLEGPVKRGGGALGNVVTQSALWLGNAGWVGYLGLPIAAAWCGVALALWRFYPTLLMQAASARGARGLDRLPLRDLLDRATERVLARQLTSPDPEVCRVAIELCREANPERAAASLARAAREAPDATRSLLVESLDRLLEAAVADPVTSRQAAGDLAGLLGQPDKVGGLDRANVVQAFGRLTADDPLPEDRALLEQAAAEPAEAVRLAAATALHRRAGDPSHGVLLALLREAARGDDAAARQIAREELRALLIQGDPEEEAITWRGYRDLLVEMLGRPEDRAPGAEALADVALRHGRRLEPEQEARLELWDDPDPRVRAAALRFAGRSGLAEHARRIVEAIGDEDDAVAAAAHDALLALGPAAAQVLLVELSYGRRSRREDLLRLVGELEVEEHTLRHLYGRELEAVRHALLHRAALDGGPVSSMVLQRLEERIEEGVYAVFLLLAALHDDEEIAELGRHFRRSRDPRRRAILLEALEALLGSEEKKALVPLLDDRPLEQRAAVTALELGIPMPTPDLAARSLLDDRDELTRLLVRASAGLSAPLARSGHLEDHRAMLEPVEIALYLKKTPLFEDLSTRHLMDLAGVVREERHRAGAVLFREGDSGTSMYLIVEGAVRITRGDTTMAELGTEEFFGEVGLLEGVERSATATTTAPSRLLRLEHDDLMELMDEFPAIAIGVAQVLSRRLRNTLQRL